MIVCLGLFAWDAACRLLGVRPRPRFGHAAEFEVEGGPLLLGCYHPSQQNTFTGKLTEPMTDAVFVARARARLRQLERLAEPPVARHGGVDVVVRPFVAHPARAPRVFEQAVPAEQLRVLLARDPRDAPVEVADQRVGGGIAAVPGQELGDRDAQSEPLARRGPSRAGAARSRPARARSRCRSRLPGRSGRPPRPRTPRAGGRSRRSARRGRRSCGSPSPAASARPRARTGCGGRAASRSARGCPGSGPSAAPLP